MMAANPIARDDAGYFTPAYTDLVVTTSSNPAYLLANDLDIDGSSLLTSVVTSPLNGTLIAFNTNGTFTYRPNAGFTGVDTFTYKVSDGSLDSNMSRVSIAVGVRLLANQNRDSNVLVNTIEANTSLLPSLSGQGGGGEGDFSSNLPTSTSLDTPGSIANNGGLQLSESVTPDQTLIYRSNSLTKPIIAVATQLSPGTAVPTSITARLVFNGVAGTSYSYSTSGLVSGQAMRFALQADGSSLATGMYDYSLEVTTTVAGVNATQAFTGKQAIVNRTSSEFGAGWSLDGLDRLFDSASGALLVKGNGDTLWYPKSGSVYTAAAGDTSNSTLVKAVNGTFALTSKMGVVSNFSTLGLLVSMVDANNNSVAYSYADKTGDSIASELASITDPFNRVTSFNYNGSKVTSIAHYSGRTTTLAYSSNSLSGYTLTDPDGAGALVAPSVAFAYGTQNISSRTNPLSQTLSFTFNTNDARLRTVTYADSSTWQVIPSETIGLPTATTGVVITKPVDAQATVTDQRGNPWKFRTDRFGAITESITGLGFIRSVLRNTDGQPVVANEPDPDGTGPLSASVTMMGYNASSDLTHVIAPDGGVRQMTYSATLHRLLSMVDPVGRTTSMTYNSSGNVLTQTDGGGFVTTYAVNARGLTTSVTTPDPDGSGPLVASVAVLAYDAMGRLITVTNPDASTKAMTYNAADQQLTSVDELGKTITNVYDALGRLTSQTNRIGAQTQFVYDAMSRVSKHTDALGNPTDFTYNNRGWLASITSPDPDGAGPLTRAVDTRGYDVNGNATGESDPGANYQGTLSFTFDADNRLVARGDSTNSNLVEQWAYDNAGRLTTIVRAGAYADRIVQTYDAANRIVSKTMQSVPFSGSPIVYATASVTYNVASEKTGDIDGRGNVTNYTYNSRGLLATETLPDPDGTGSQFRSIIAHSYDNMGRKTRVDRGFGRITTLKYNNRSWLIRTTDPDPDAAGPLASPVTQFGYNVRGDRTSVTDPLNRTTSFTFDNAQRLLKQTDPDPDGAGPLTRPETSQTYNAVNRVLTTTNATAGVTSMTYDNLGRVLTKTDPDPDGAGSLLSPVTTLVYSMQGLASVTDPMARVTSYVRDNRGRVTAVTDPAGNTTTYAYDFYDRKTSETAPDPDGAGSLTGPVTSYTFDSVNRLLTKTDPKNGTTTYTYDLASNLTSLKDSVNNTTNFGYDSLNRLVLNTNALSKSKSYVYDVAGTLARTVDRNGRVIQNVYDSLDRQTEERWQQSATPTPTLTVSTTQEGGSLNEVQSVGWTIGGYGLSGTFTLSFNGQTTAAIAYNATDATIKGALEALSTVGAGNVKVTVAAVNFNRTFTITFQNSRGGNNVPQTTINTSGLSVAPAGSPSSFANTTVQGGGYTESQTIALANATGGTWRLAYNGEISSPLSPTITAAGVKAELDAFIGIDNVTVTGSNGNFTVTFGGAQSATNMQQIFGDAADTTSGTTQRLITTTYNAASEVTSVSDPSSTITYTRDGLGRANSIAETIAGLSSTITLNQSFDSMNNRTELKATIGTTLDFKNSYQYDKLQRLTDIVQQGQSGGNAVAAKHFTQSYNSLSQRTNISRYQSTGLTNAVATSDFTYDTSNRLSGIAHKQGANNLNTYAYAHDPLSRISSVTSTAEGATSYSYDQTSQVVGATNTGVGNETYGFDANGNRNTTGFTTGSNNQTTAGLGFTYTYDDEGNRITKTETSTGKVSSYEWDYRNRLIGVKDRNTSGGAIVKQVGYQYDAMNRLVRRDLDADGAGNGVATSQFWVYDEGINAVLQFDGSGASNLSHRYLWSNSIDEIFADEQLTSVSVPGNVLYPLSDHLGTPRDIVDLNEGTGVTSVTNHRRYDAFGKLISETNTGVDLIYGFTGKQLDEATGLQHNLNRWYDAALGQWMSEDPIGFDAGDANVRRYVLARVTQLTDPSGLDPFVSDPPGKDSDGDGIPDREDPDKDNNGIPDACEPQITRERLKEVAARAKAHAEATALIQEQIDLVSAAERQFQLYALVKQKELIFERDNRWFLGEKKKAEYQQKLDQLREGARLSSQQSEETIKRLIEIQQTREYSRLDREGANERDIHLRIMLRIQELQYRERLRQQLQQGNSNGQ
jgi:RHS repeat-associated protein